MAMILLISFIVYSCKYHFYFVTHFTLYKLRHNETPVKFLCDHHHEN
ncbi:hypothetical protein yaldo0001_16830 [Yersinia aldovae ATCC 35236]|nr:hypothetical protein yaldo0001_16830 [Yersinia aldovae ATCC 35236]